ncbi:MAG TPA: peptidylprolyl isomerase [Polyangiaceae bacterium]|nr:peptidylprolyl isomerase [Polyangiaceae bacterium]
MKLRFLPLFLLLASCSKASGADPDHAVVARVGKVQLTEQDVQRAIARDPGATAARFDSPAARRELLDGLVRFELLAQAAERAGFDKDPDAVHALRQIAVTKLVNQKLAAAAAPESITRADLEREYAARQASEFTVPGAVQIRHLRVADEKQAESLAKQARALAPDDDQGFAKLAVTHSQDLATRASGGDLGFIEAGSKLPPVIVEAARKLITPGEIAGPLPTEQGYEILRLVSVRATAVSPFSSVEEPLRQRLYRERRAQALDALIAELKKETPVDLR